MALSLWVPMLTTTSNAVSIASHVKDDISFDVCGLAPIISTGDTSEG
jgi:hypothetical protein